MNGATVDTTGQAGTRPRAPGTMYDANDLATKSRAVRISRAYGLGRLDHQGGASRNPQRHMGNLAAAPAFERLTFAADYDRGFSQSMAEWAPTYGKAWPLDMGA